MVEDCLETGDEGGLGYDVVTGGAGAAAGRPMSLGVRSQQMMEDVVAARYETMAWETGCLTKMLSAAASDMIMMFRYMR